MNDLLFWVIKMIDIQIEREMDLKKKNDDGFQLKPEKHQLDGSTQTNEENTTKINTNNNNKKR